VRRKDNPEPPLATGTAERLAAIVEAAERAAVTVIDDAEAQARRRLEQAEAEADRLVADRLDSLTDLIDSLVAQAAAIRDQSKQLLASLAEAKRRIAVEAGVEIAAVEDLAESARAPHLSAVEFPAAAPTTELRPGGGEGAAAGARLLATQMAVSGSSREEIEARLRNGFEIEDTASILDAILGPED
jgi:cell division septum initiation protein DivIVA